MRQRNPPRRVRASARLVDTPQVTAFAEKMGALLEVASGHFKAGQVDDAIEFLTAAVELCEEHPTLALRPLEKLGANLQQVVSGCVENALAKRTPHAQLAELRARLEAVRQMTFH
jgi:hypothetical protein